MPLSATDARALFARLASVDDPCARRGRRHSQRSLLAIVLCAVISGAQGPTAIAEWGRRLPPPMLRCRRAVDGRYEPPPSPRSAVCSRPSISRRLRRHWGIVSKCRRPRSMNPWHSMARPCVARRMVAMGRRLRARKRRGLEGEGGGPDKASELKAVKPLLDPLPLAGRVFPLPAAGRHCWSSGSCCDTPNVARLCHLRTPRAVP
ncbi:transposase family protein [Acidiferrobacter sp. SPIII_3]|uniref:transposase family protein n=1 Tax=Acidiferrobacter sp. SPIII_3 TaxID=1281578 RepID=UPI0011AB446D